MDFKYAGHDVICYAVELCALYNNEGGLQAWWVEFRLLHCHRIWTALPPSSSFAKEEPALALPALLRDVGDIGCCRSSSTVSTASALFDASIGAGALTGHHLSSTALESRCRRVGLFGAALTLLASSADGRHECTLRDFSCATF